MLFPFHLFKLQRRRRNIDGKMNLGRIERGVEKRRLHQSGDVAFHLAASPRLQIFLDRVSSQKIRRPGVAIATPCADRGSSTVHFHLHRVEAPFVSNCSFVAEKVILILIFGDPVQTTQQIIGVDDHKPAGAVGELIENLLVVGSAGWEWRNNRPGLRVGTVKVRVSSASSSAAGSTTTGSTMTAASSPASTRSPKIG